MRRSWVGAVLLAAALHVGWAGADTPEEWEQGVIERLRQHPQLLAAASQRARVLAEADALDQPLHNPELEAEAEREGEDRNYTFGVSHTFDLWNRRGARQAQAAAERQAAERRFAHALAEHAGEALIALVEWHAAKQSADLVEQQQSRLNRLLELVEERTRAGDLGRADATLTRLSLGQRLIAVAQAEVREQQAISAASERLPEWTPESGGIPAGFWNHAGSAPTTGWPDSEPAVAEARAAWQATVHEAEQARREARPEPTLGLSAGRMGEERLLALSLSFPLNVRNNFSADIQAASEAALEAEAGYRAVRRQQEYDWRAEKSALGRLEFHQGRWEALQEAEEDLEALLESQWSTGDLDTQAYLLALDELTDNRLAGIALQQSVQTARINTMLKSGAIARIFSPARFDAQ